MTLLLLNKSTRMDLASELLNKLHALFIFKHRICIRLAFPIGNEGYTSI